jgi:hypothetical protein
MGNYGPRRCAPKDKSENQEKNHRKTKELPKEQEKRGTREDDVRCLDLAYDLPAQEASACEDSPIALDLADSGLAETSTGIDGTIIPYFADNGLAEASPRVDSAVALNFADRFLAKTSAGIDHAVAIKFANDVFAEKTVS